MEGIAAILRRASRGAAPEEIATNIARQQPMALRFSKFRSPEEFEAAGRDLGARAAKARSPEELAAINAEANALQGAYTRFTASQGRSLKEIEADITALEARGAKAATAEERAALEAESRALGAELEQLAQARSSKGPAFGTGPISPNERIVLQSKYGEERVLDPRTGYPQSVGGQPLRYDYTDPFEQMGKRLGQLEGNQASSPSGMAYLYQKSRALSPEGYPLSVRGPGGQMQKLEGFTPGQRLAQIGAGGAGTAIVGGAAMRDREAPLSSYTGDEADAEALMRKYANAPAAAPPAQLMPQFGINQFSSDMGRTYTGDETDAAALVRKYGTPAGSARPAPAAPAARTAERPAPAREEPGFLSRALSKVYDPDYQKGMSSREMFEAAQKSPGPRGEEYSAAREITPAEYFRAAARAREEGEGRASGGAANGKPNKDAALHKALEIIQMMLSRR